MATEWEKDAAQFEESRPLAPYGERGCDCGYTIEKLQAENARLKELVKELWEEVEYDGDLPTRNQLEPKVNAALTGKEQP